MYVPGRATLGHRLSRGDRLGVHWLALGSAALAEASARAKPDAIVIDMQHGLWTRRELEAAIGVAPADLPVLVRVAELSAMAIGEALDAGAEGVIVPLVETAKQAARAVRLAHYPPRGKRSGGGVRPLADFVDYVESARHDTVVIVMIETARGLANAARIARTPGVDMVFIGTGDLSLSLGAFPGSGHLVDSACAEIHQACRAAWTPCGIFTGTVEAARRRREQGYRMVVTANDIDLVQSGFARATARFAAPADTTPESIAHAGRPAVAAEAAAPAPTIASRLVNPE
jgi:2-dehydro-3-deoxyglucarate aldolase/4-hydroxy-2-oxoheptanedioate aldolase